MKSIVQLVLVFCLSSVVLSCSQDKKNEELYREIVNLNKVPLATKVKSKQYVWGSADIPVIEDFEIMEDETTNFDTASGNIVISSYRGYTELGEVKEFYAKSLPQLGWELVNDSESDVSYKRNSDNLEISLKRNGRESQVKFFLSSM